MTLIMVATSALTALLIFFLFSCSCVACAVPCRAVPCRAVLCVWS